LPRAFWRDLKAAAVTSENPRLPGAVAALEADAEFEAVFARILLRLRRPARASGKVRASLGSQLPRKTQWIGWAISQFEQTVFPADEDVSFDGAYLASKNPNWPHEDRVRLRLGTEDCDPDIAKAAKAITSWMRDHEKSKGRAPEEEWDQLAIRARDVMKLCHELEW
jgi:hypothetical protein